MRILLIEDDELVADAVVRGLSLAGFTVDHAASAEHARAALSTEHFDLAVLDIGLPGADGLTLLGTLRDEGKTMPVLMLTASRPNSPRAAARCCGVPVCCPAAACASDALP
jgi:DNA-binding response OmpR family regulator